ncbi:MAG: hypothetical protein CVU56_19190 [Deltaproteobacteria bacterium HGW-Deltaproteobacteria-14]|nr:MAG: hypothetical protein CVU56_19190 [Deltaproteobacteria bacterium HGW-Deltaproteobacteria-14]
MEPVTPPSAPRPGTPSRLYRGLRATVRAGMKAFYRTIEVTGSEHLDGARPAILASNHPNSIIDPLLLGLIERRQVAFCARDGLFKVPIFGRVLRSVGAIPISRPTDHAGKVDNAGAFAAAREVLSGGGVISIFPEGRTHQNLKVHQVKTGAARIALDAAAATGGDLDVAIVPVGLNYLVRQAFRSDVHVAFGEPIPVAEFVALNATDPRAAVRALTARLEEALRELAIHVEEDEDERIIAQVTSLIVDIRAEEGLDAGGQTPAERTALVRRIVEAYRWLQELDPEQTAVLRRRLQRYLDERSGLGLGGNSNALQHRGQSARGGAGGWRATRRYLVLGAPVAAYGMLNSALPYLTLRGLLRVADPRRDRQALFKFLTGAALYGGLWGAQVIVVAGALGPVVAIVYAATLPTSALFALRYMTEARLHRLTLSGLRAWWEHGDRLESLRRERDALRADLAALRERYLAQLTDAPAA